MWKSLEKDMEQYRIQKTERRTHLHNSRADHIDPGDADAAYRRKLVPLTSDLRDMRHEDDLRLNVDPEMCSRSNHKACGDALEMLREVCLLARRCITTK